MRWRTDAELKGLASFVSDFGAMLFYGNLIIRRPVQTLDGTGTWVMAAQGLVVLLARRRPWPALGLCIAIALLSAGTGGGPDLSAGAIVICAAAIAALDTGGVRGAGSLAAAFTALAAVAFVPWLLHFDSNTVFPGPARESNAGMAFFLLAAAFLIRGDVVRALLSAREADERAEKAVANERARIARELHDVVAHQMSVVVAQAQGASAVLASDPTKARRALDTISSTSREALVELRRLVDVDRGDTVPAMSFDPAVPQPGVGLDDLGRLAATAEAAGLTVAMDIEWATSGGVPVGLALSAYRTIQEALTNAAKHAPGADVSVLIREEPTALRVVVTNGPPKGRPTDLPGSGVGLIGMRERVSVFGGTLETGPTPDGGWRVVATFPTMDASTSSE
jgi:signal transduction histidine kinase